MRETITGVAPREPTYHHKKQIRRHRARSNGAHSHQTLLQKRAIDGAEGRTSGSSKANSAEPRQRRPRQAAGEGSKLQFPRDILGGFHGAHAFITLHLKGIMEKMGEACPTPLKPDQSQPCPATHPRGDPGGKMHHWVRSSSQVSSWRLCLSRRGGFPQPEPQDPWSRLQRCREVYVFQEALVPMRLK